jgi:membrane dipeptidase
MENESIQINRRRVLQTAAAAGLATLGSALFGRGALADAAASMVYSARAVKVVERSLVIDMLAPLRMDFETSGFTAPLTSQEAAMFRQSGVTAFHHSIGLGGPTAHEDALAYLAAWQGFAGRNSELFSLVGKASDLDAAKRSQKIAVIMGIQNSDQFREVKDVRIFHELGLRCSQLTYNSQNLLGSGSTDREDGGISDFGADIVKAMNDVGMLVDVSHCGDRTTLDAIDISAKPIAVTHSNCRALNNHPRLKTDEAIRQLAAKGGVMGITEVRMFVRDKDPTTVEHIVDHIDHVVKLVGIDHVGIGSDAGLTGYDNMPPEQLKMLRGSYKASYAMREKLDTDDYGPKRVYALTDALIRRGYSDQNIVAILGGNFRRLLGSIWA